MSISGKVAIIYTTFMRDDLMYKTVRSILDNWQDEFCLLIGDQNPSVAKEEKICDMSGNKDVKYVALGFDCGLSQARNMLVDIAHTLGIKYCFVTADSIVFTASIDLNPIISFLQEEPNRGLVGFDLKNRTPWEYNMCLDSFGFILTKADKRICIGGIDYIECDICRNFFLAKTELLLKNKWDNTLKLSEHEDMFYRIKTQTSYKVFFTKCVVGEYIDSKPMEYVKYRSRMYGIYRKKLQQKYSIRGWIKIIDKCQSQPS
jgi:hypothetical protein